MLCVHCGVPNCSSLSGSVNRRVSHSRIQRMCSSTDVFINGCVHQRMCSSTYVLINGHFYQRMCLSTDVPLNGCASPAVREGKLRGHDSERPILDPSLKGDGATLLDSQACESRWRERRVKGWRGTRGYV
jgi:hypothetical protein